MGLLHPCADTSQAVVLIALTARDSMKMTSRLKSKDGSSSALTAVGLSRQYVLAVTGWYCADLNRAERDHSLGVSGSDVCNLQPIESSDPISADDGQWGLKADSAESISCHSDVPIGKMSFPVKISGVFWN